LFKRLVPILLIYVSQSAHAFDSGNELRMAPPTRDLSSIADLFPDLDDLACTPRCEGARGCGQFQDIDACIDDGAELNCSWVCH
jgi:hypothetical protein